MAYVTEIDRLSILLERAADTRMTLAEIIEEEVNKFKKSTKYSIMVEAEKYYLNRTDIQNKTIDVKNRSNTKIEHPILKKLVDQKINYLLSRPFTVSCDNEQYAEALNDIFDDVFRRKIKSFGKGAIKTGICWLQPYFNTDGKLAFMRIPATEIIPMWKDAEHTELDSFIRIYSQTIYEGKKETEVTKAEYWDRTGVKYFVSRETGTGFIPDVDKGIESSHFTIDGKGYNFEQPPIVWVKYNEEELPLFYFIKELIDDINWQTSVTADVLRDIAKFIYVLRNYGGQDLAEFIKDLKNHMAIKVTSEGGVDKLQADLNIDAVMKFLDKQRRDVFDYGAGVDTKDPELGNASGTAINFRYMDLDNDCNNFALELKDAFQHMKPFLDTYLQIIGKGDFTGETFDIIFNSDMPIEETDVINNIRNSEGIISKRTQLENHPWITDVDAELERIEEEKTKAMKRFGAGLFDNMIGGGGGGEQEQ